MKHYGKNDVVKMLQPKTREVLVEGDDTAYIIKSLSGYEIIKTQLAGQNGMGAEDQLYDLISKSVIDDNGEFLFTMDEARQLDNIRSNTLMIEVYDLNGLSPEAVKQAKEQLKNQIGSSTTN